MGFFNNFMPKKVKISRADINKVYMAKQSMAVGTKRGTDRGTMVADLMKNSVLNSNQDD